MFILMVIQFLSGPFSSVHCATMLYEYRESRYFPSLRSGRIGIKCDSLFHPYAQGPKGENVGSITQPLPSNYLIFRAASESDGERFWGFFFPPLFFITHCDNVQLPWELLSSFSSGNCDCLCRPLLDGCFGAGAELLQSLQVDGQSRARGRHQHVFRVFPFPPPAAGQRAQWRGSFTVSNQLSRGPNKKTPLQIHAASPHHSKQQDPFSLPHHCLTSFRDFVWFSKD